jgi:WD40 repeat protein
LRLLFLFSCGHSFSMEKNSGASQQEYSYKVLNDDNNKNEKLISIEGKFYFTELAAFSGNSKYFAISLADRDGKKNVLFSDLSLENVTTIEQSAHALALDDKGDQLAIIRTMDKKICLWERKSQKCKPIKNPGRPPLSITFSPDGNMLAITYSDDTVRFWDIPNNSFRKKELKGGGALSFSPDGQKVVIQQGARSNTAEVYNLFADHPPVSFTFKSSNLHLMYGPKEVVYGLSYGNVLDSFNAETGIRLDTVEFVGTDDIDRLAICPDRDSIHGVTKGQAFEWEIGSDRHSVIGPFERGIINITAISPNGLYALRVQPTILRIRAIKDIKPKKIKPNK